MHPVDLSLIRQSGAPTIAPDGSRIVVAITRPDFATDSNVSLLREFACHGQTSGEITPGAGRCRPDIEPAAEPPRILPGYRGRYNGRGYIFDRPHHLFHVPVAAVHEDPDFEPVGRAAALADGDDVERFEVALPRPTRLTSGDVGFPLTDVTSSGRHVLAIAGLHEDHDTNLRTDLFAIHVKTKGEDSDAPIAVTTSDGADVLLGVSGACPPQDAPKRTRLPDFARGLRSTTILPAAERIYPSKDDYPVHGRAIRQALGTLDADDVLAFLDGVLAEFDQLDAERLGIMGGSYGGYLTAWIIAHDHRFRGAIVERAYLDPAAFVGPSDIGWFFSDE
ncbi:hypothetical protein BSZ39_10670 [Bowdeniella nasicola]|uniref:Peptidase S9 prolyl oligopeptidase catalytic domain-containing protein n=1 Tax=Bowdeniella nasicola TaxID=208480 RepID=A0A1Q5Q016_9ACTO|nr:hypothetical protein BSZ39_10670 [Bowdeniella nasicola]